MRSTVRLQHLNDGERPQRRKARVGPRKGIQARISRGGGHTTDARVRALRKRLQGR